MTDELNALADACDDGSEFCRELSAHEKPTWERVRDYRWQEPLETATKLADLAQAIREGRVTIAPRAAAKGEG